VSGLREINTKSGNRMGFVTLEDVEGSVEVTVFPETFRQSAAHLRSGAPVLVRGKVEGGTGTRKLLAEEIRPFPAEGTSSAVRPRRCLIRVPPGRDGTADLEALRAILSAHPGPVGLDLSLDVEATEVVIRSRTLGVTPSRELVATVEALLGADSVRFEE
jgi:DNA polymerase-3 subunit alpha